MTRVDRHLHRRLGPEVGVEGDQSFDLVARAAGIAGQLLQLLKGQPTPTGLNGSQGGD